jgi:hypothetical protein
MGRRWTRSELSRQSVLLLTPGFGEAALAREPGVGQSFTPGITLGQANAVPRTPGLRLAN